MPIYVTILSSFTHSDELLVDCPDYQSLAPRPSLRSKKLHPKKQKSKVEKEEEEEEGEEITDEIRMCSPCEKLIDRWVGFQILTS